MKCIQLMLKDVLFILSTFFIEIMINLSSFMGKTTKLESEIFFLRLVFHFRNTFSIFL
jgi:hypothetical protein